MTDSSATMGNMLGGSSSDAHSQELMAFLWFIIAAFEIRVWVEWLPSKQNPGDPFSRPLTHKKGAFEIVGHIDAEWSPPVLAPTVVQSPHAWEWAMSSKVDPALWSNSQQLKFVAELGALEPAELASALCAAVRAPPESAQVLQLGY